jgi:hypothetical protein
MEKELKDKVYEMAKRNCARTGEHVYKFLKEVTSRHFETGKAYWYECINCKEWLESPYSLF